MEKLKQRILRDGQNLGDASAHGAGPEQAAAVAKAVARAEAMGNIICGLYYLESYCVQLASGRVEL